MAVEAGYSKIATSGSVFIYDTGDTINSYIGEPTTNLLPYSQQFDSWGAGDVVVTANATYAPDGTLTADFFRANNIASYHYIYQVISISSSTTYTFSCYVKPAGGFNGNTNTFFMQTNDGSWKNITFNLSSLSYSATAGTTGYVQPLANGWYRVGWTIPIATGGSLYWYFYPTSAPSAETQGGGYYIWGAQLEQKSHMTQYLPTTTTSATRSNTQGLLDISGGGNSLNLVDMSYDANAMMTFDGTNDKISNTTSITFGTRFSMEAVVYRNNATTGDIISSWNNPYIFLWRVNSSGYQVFAWNGGGAAQTITATSVIGTGAYKHIAITGDGTNIVTYNNGVATDTFAKAPNMSNFTAMQIGANTYDSIYFNGYIPVVKVYNRALSAAEVLSNYNHYKTRFNIT
jgi:hypothetical protein